MNHHDVIIIGAGASGMMCAIHAGARGRSILLLDHAAQVGNKIRISGGGRCNFTNSGASAAQYLSNNPHFCKSALSRFPAENFLDLLKKHGIPYIDKSKGQLFCKNSAQDIVAMLKQECDQAGARFELSCRVEKIEHSSGTPASFHLTTNKGEFSSESLCVATGGLSIPKIGATGFGYEIARQFGLRIVELAPALDGFTLNPATAGFRELTGISLECGVTCRGVSFREALLFTHQGLSGPAALQASLYWRPGDSLFIDFLPEHNIFEWFIRKKAAGNRGTVKNLLAELLPTRLAERLSQTDFSSPVPKPQVSEKILENFCRRLHGWEITPTGTVGYDKAEVTRGGVDTDELSSKTMECKKVPGLFFIGEVVDVTGWLGGYNLHWAWASGYAAGLSV